MRALTLVAGRPRTGPARRHRMLVRRKSRRGGKRHLAKPRARNRRESDPSNGTFRRALGIADDRLAFVATFSSSVIRGDSVLNPTSPGPTHSGESAYDKRSGSNGRCRFVGRVNSKVITLYERAATIKVTRVA